MNQVWIVFRVGGTWRGIRGPSPEVVERSPTTPEKIANPYPASLIAAYPDKDVAELHAKEAMEAFRDWREVHKHPVNSPARLEAVDRWKAYDPAADLVWVNVVYRVKELPFYQHPDQFQEAHGR